MKIDKQKINNSSKEDNQSDRTKILPDMRFPSACPPIESDPSVLRTLRPRPSPAFLHRLCWWWLYKVSALCPSLEGDINGAPRTLRNRKKLLSRSIFFFSTSSFQYFKLKLDGGACGAELLFAVDAAWRLGIDHRRVRRHRFIHLSWHDVEIEIQHHHSQKSTNNYLLNLSYTLILTTLPLIRPDRKWDLGQEHQILKWTARICGWLLRIIYRWGKIDHDGDIVIDS